MPTITLTVLAVAAVDTGPDSQEPEEGGGLVPPASGSETAAGAPAEESSVSSRTLLVGGALLGLLLLYMGAYVVQAANVARYGEGFILSECPVCGRGTLFVEDRRYRTLGLPRVRRVVRCNECRSVLRQVGRERWRYAVDGAEDALLFDRYNGRVLSERDLLALGLSLREQPLEYIEGDDI